MENKRDIEETIIDTSSLVRAPCKDTPIPDRVGPYKIKGLLKTGGTSLMYLGVQIDSNELIAIKVLSPKMLKHPEMVDYFLKEAKMIEMADHPNVVKLFGHGKWEGGLYIAMEFVRGISLRKLIMQNILSFNRSLEIIIEVASALSHLHSHRIVHRDLKPDNILLSEEGGIKVIDFGISRLIEEASLNKNKRIMGTPTYMSPEQKENPLEVSFPSDIYSLAIIAYELCIGRLSYGVLQLSLLPKGLRKIIAKALQPQINDRYLSVEDFLEDLKNYIENSFEENEELLDLSLKELSDFYEDVSFTLHPKNTIFMQKLHTARAAPKGILSSHIYSDFLTLSDDCLAVFVGWPEKKGVQGMFNNAVLKGLVQALHEKITAIDGNVIPKAISFLHRLNQHIHKSSLSTYSVSFIMISFSQDLIHYFSCGPNRLFIQSVGGGSLHELKAENNLLSEKVEENFLHITSNFHVGDMVYLFSSFETLPLDDNKIILSVEGSYLSSGNDRAKEILKALNPNVGVSDKELPLMLTTLQRKR